MNKKYIQLITITIVCTVFGACTISYSFTGASIPPKAKTISVKYFPNYAAIIYPSLSNEFTEALKDKFASQTNLQLTNDKGDLNFEGEITGFVATPQAIEKDAAAINRLTITIKVRYESTLEPDKNFEQAFSRYEDYDANKNLDQVQGELSTLIIEQLTEDIFNKSVVNW